MKIILVQNQMDEHVVIVPADTILEIYFRYARLIIIIITVRKKKRVN